MGFINYFLTEPCFTILIRLSIRRDRHHVIPEQSNLLLNPQAMKRALNTSDYTKMSIQDLLNVITNDFHNEMKETFETVNLQLTTAYNLEPREEELEFACVTMKQTEKKFVEHIEKEEQLLFPLFSISKKRKNNSADGIDLEEFIDGLRSEHNWIRQQIGQIRKATNNYKSEPAFTPSHKLAYAQLNDLEQDFTRLFFIEEEYLFPRALKIHAK
jgi:iron-sulfur cluster repair protein YtfE (RIC family)